MRMENLNIQQFLHIASVILKNLRLREGIGQPSPATPRGGARQFYLFEALGKNSLILMSAPLTPNDV